jgi:hypothetical protein
MESSTERYETIEEIKRCVNDPCGKFWIAVRNWQSAINKIFMGGRGLSSKVDDEVCALLDRAEAAGYRRCVETIRAGFVAYVEHSRRQGRAALADGDQSGGHPVWGSLRTSTETPLQAPPDSDLDIGRGLVPENRYDHQAASKSTLAAIGERVLDSQEISTRGREAYGFRGAMAALEANRQPAPSEKSRTDAYAVIGERLLAKVTATPRAPKAAPNVAVVTPLGGLPEDRS